MRQGIEQEVRKLLQKTPMTAAELAEALGYKTKMVYGLKSAGKFRIRKLEDKGLVEFNRETGKWHWIGDNQK